MQKTYMLYGLFITLVWTIFVHSTQFSKFNAIQLQNGDITYRIIPSEDNTYGYEIFVKKKLLIHQPDIPGMTGNKGFTQKSDAEKVAKLVIQKLQKGIMPPTIGRKELDSLKINLYGF
jgi:hypothetical protein